MAFCWVNKLIFIDQLIHQSDREIAHLIHQEAETLLQTQASTREQLAGELLDKFPDLSFAELQDFLTKLIFIANVAGQNETDAEADNG